MLRTAGGKLFHMLGSQAEKAGPCPFHDGCSGMRRPELTSMNDERKATETYLHSTSQCCKELS